MTSGRTFVLLWSLAVAASVAAFVLHLALRSRTVQLGYELGQARSEQAQLRETKRVLELEAASFQTPQRVEVVARTLLGMQPPRQSQMISIGGLSVSTPSAGGPTERSRATALSAAKTEL